MRRMYIFITIFIVFSLSGCSMGPSIMQDKMSINEQPSFNMSRYKEQGCSWIYVLRCNENYYACFVEDNKAERKLIFTPVLDRDMNYLSNFDMRNGDVVCIPDADLLIPVDDSSGPVILERISDYVPSSYIEFIAHMKVEDYWDNNPKGRYGLRAVKESGGGLVILIDGVYYVYCDDSVHDECELIGEYRNYEDVTNAIMDRYPEERSIHEKEDLKRYLR